MEKLHPLLEHWPADISRAIGRIVSTQALVEHYIQMCIVTLTGLGKKESRLVLGEPRVEDRLQTVKRLIKVHGLTVAIPAELTAKNLKRAREERNLVAHGLWTVAPHGYIVIQTMGTDASGESRKINPVGVITDAEALASVLAEITGLLKAAQVLRSRIDAALAAFPRTAR